MSLCALCGVEIKEDEAIDAYPLLSGEANGECCDVCFDGKVQPLRWLKHVEQSLYFNRDGPPGVQKDTMELLRIASTFIQQVKRVFSLSPAGTKTT